MTNTTKSKAQSYTETTYKFIQELDEGIKEVNKQIIKARSAEDVRLAVKKSLQLCKLKHDLLKIYATAEGMQDLENDITEKIINLSKATSK